MYTPKAEVYHHVPSESARVFRASDSDGDGDGDDDGDTNPFDDDDEEEEAGRTAQPEEGQRRLFGIWKVSAGPSSTGPFRRPRS
jgi:hypothetical protein